MAFLLKNQIESATLLETGNVNYWTGNQTTLFKMSSQNILE